MNQEVLSPNRNTALDGVRGLAIVLVLLYHATMTLGHHLEPIRAVLQVTQSGWLGVEVFFALSGFLITRILLQSRHQPAKSFFGTFFFRRAVRILPLYLAVLTILLVALLTVSALNTPQASRFLTLQGWFWFHSANVLREFHGAHSPSLEFGWFELTHFWSLAVEQHFYLVWPFLVYLMSVRGLRVASIAIIGCSVVLRTGLVGIDSPVAAALLATPKYLAGLALGGLAATYADSVPKHQLARLAKLGGIASVLVLACAMFVTSAADQGDAFRGWVAPLAALATACTALLVCAHPDGRLARVLSSPVLVTYGKYSYGIYVFHVLPGPLTRQIELASFPGGYSVGALVYVGLFMTVPLAVSMVSYRYWELPWLRLKLSPFPRAVPA